MNNSGNSVTSNPLNPLGLGYPAQAILGVLLAIFIYSIFFSAEYLYRLIKGYNKQKTELIPFTASNKSYQLLQDPSAPENKSVHLSDNERTGVEFSYVFFVYVDKLDGASNTTLLKHIFHKGYRSQQNLLGPAVYMLSNNNTMRVYMSTYKRWNNSVEIENIPMKKWVHVAVICESNGLNVFINGNIAKRMNFEGSLPYQNYGDVYVLSDKTATTGTNKPNYPSNLGGRLDGMISNLFYYNYALSYTEINEHMNIGPSKKTDPDTKERPQYLTDNWWIA